MIKKYPFNLIEITLALMVISVGVTSIMGLIPIGAKAHQDALHLNHAADAADEVLHYAGFLLEQGGGLPPNTKPDPDVSHDITIGWALVDSAQEGDYFYANGTPGVYRILRRHEVKNRETGSFIRTVHEMDATMVIWYSDVEGFYRDSAGVIQSGNLPKAKRLNVEVSWPGSVAYAKRQTASYALEVTLP